MSKSAKNKKKVTKKTETVYVYRGINRTKKEVYHGVSKDIKKRKDGSHCVGGTKALAHWDCDNDTIIWRKVSTHRKQTTASAKSHEYEKKYKHRDKFKNIKTKGI